MAVDPNIKKKADDIRNKVYGREVRESLASGLEEMSSDVVENEVRQSIVESRQDSVESQWQAVSDEMTDKDVISAPEIIAAREGEANLKARLDKEHQEVTARLAQIVEDDAVSPEQFEGNDYEKVQQAVNYIHDKKGGFVAFSRMYNLTGHPSINIPKTASNDRSPLIFGGRGGGIVKQDAGWMFDSETRNVGDVYFVNVLFESINGRGTGIINGTNLIRTQWHNSHARYVDHILHSDGYTQSNVFNGGSIIGGSGWAFKAEGYYDFVMTGGLLVEHREHFFLQEFQGDSPNTHRALYNVRFRDIVIEGLSGKTFDIQRVESLVVDGVYLESNKGGYFDFTRADYLDGLQISNVRSYNSTSFIEENNLTAFIEWGGEVLGVSTHNIYSRNLPIHDTTLASIDYRLRIYSHQDLALDTARDLIENIDPNNIVIEQKNTQNYPLTNNVGTYNRGTYLGLNSNDLDDYIKTGTFNVSNSYSNIPDVVDRFGIIEVKNMGSDIIQQIYIERPSTRVHVRIKGGTVPTWSDWGLKEEYPIMNKEGVYSTATTLGVDSTDLNNFDKSGFFQIDSNSVANAPSTVDRWGGLEVKRTGGNMVWQEYTSRPNIELFKRVRENDTWTEWKSFG